MGYDEIIKFYRAECDAALKDPNFVMSSDILTNGGLDIGKFSYSELRAGCVGLCFTSLQRGMNMSVDNDLRHLWDTVGRYLLGSSSIYFSDPVTKQHSFDDFAVEELFVMTIKIATEEWELRQGQTVSYWSGNDYNPGDRIVRANLNAYLLYPLLEAVLKRRLSGYFSRDGTIITAFTVPGQSYSVGKFCSSVKDIFMLLLQNERSSNLGKDLNQILNHIVFIYPGKDALTVIGKEWRNPAMHGADVIPTAWGVLLNIVLLVAMADVETRLIAHLGP